MAIGLSKTNLLKSYDKDIGNEKDKKHLNDSFDTKTSKEENVIEINQTLTQSFVTENIKAENQESTVFPVISEKSNSKIDDNENNNSTASLQIGCIERAIDTETPFSIGKDIRHENKNQEETMDKSKEILTEKAEKEENSHFKEVVSGVIKSLAQSNCTENKNISEVTSSQTVIKEENDISKIVKDQGKEDDVLSKEDSADQENHGILENSDVEETFLQDRIKNNDQVKKEENKKEHVNHENLEILEQGNLEENILQQIDDQDKQVTNIEEHVMLEIIRNSKNPEENIIQNNMKVDCQIKEEEKFNNLNPQTSSTEENVNKEEEISNNNPKIHDHADANTEGTLENVEFCQNVKTDEETTTEIQTDAPEAENIDITVKVKIQTIPLGSVSEQEILDYNESEDIEKSECDEEVDEE